jgi:thiamine pyrophosphate-dependent acetolactate synthase large subunit-like protein
MSKDIKLEDIERPVSTENAELAWGSDAIAEVLRKCDVSYIAMVPGSSYRGLQDSLVNYLGNANPQMLVCLHEEHAVAIAHGYAKITGRAMAAGIHSNVGLMHASMAIYNAYCDRVPVLLLGATGPVDAHRRRPWIDWIHTSRDQGALVRPYVKWDEQPASPKAGVEATLRAWQLIHAHPQAPAYVCFDVSDQEARVDMNGLVPDDVSRFLTQPVTRPTDDAIAHAVELLRAAKRPVILAGRSTRLVDDWNRRVRLAEFLNAQVITDMKMPSVFPTAHPLHVANAAQFLSPDQKQVIAEADLILNLDWMDLAGALQQSLPAGAGSPKVISATLDDYMVNGWNYDHYALPQVDVRLASTSDEAVRLLSIALGVSETDKPFAPKPRPAKPQAGDVINQSILASSLREALKDHQPSYLRFPLGWPAEETPFDHPHSYLGADGGAGIGSGPGMAVGAALALRDSGRLPVAVLGDGDFAMGGTAIWTAARYRIPLLVIISNNQSYFNDEIHQETVANIRERPVANRWIGQRLDDPAVHNPSFAQSLGAQSTDTVMSPADLPAALEKAISAVAAGGVYVLDVRVQPGYVSAMPAVHKD